MAWYACMRLSLYLFLTSIRAQVPSADQRRIMAGLNRPLHPVTITRACKNRIPIDCYGKAFHVRRAVCASGGSSHNAYGKIDRGCKTGSRLYRGRSMGWTETY